MLNYVSQNVFLKLFAPLQLVPELLLLPAPRQLLRGCPHQHRAHALPHAIQQQ